MRTPSRTSRTARPALVQVETVTAATAPPRPSLPWPVAALGGAFLAALGGWAIVACLVVWGELAATGRVNRAGVVWATQFWLLAHGGPAVVDGLRLTLVPGLLTALAVFLLHGVAGFAARQACLARGWATAGAVPEPQRRRWALVVGGAVAGGYAVIVTVAAVLVDPGGSAVRAGLGAVVTGALAGLWGAGGETAWRPWEAWPAWARAVPRAVGAAVAVLLLGGVVALASGLVAHREAVAALFGQLQPGVSGSILLGLLQAAYLPDFVVWAACWTIGAGFGLGGDSVVVLLGQTVDAVPAFPVVAALPGASVASWWNLVWLGWGVAAGVVAAWIVLRSRPRARFDETAVVGGVAGIAAGFVFWLLAMATRGGLGVTRLVGLGPLPLATLVLAPTLLGLAGLTTGLVAGLLRAPGAAGDRTPAVTEQVARTVRLWTGEEAGDRESGGAEPFDAEATQLLRRSAELPTESQGTAPASPEPRAVTRPAAESQGAAPASPEAPAVTRPERSVEPPVSAEVGTVVAPPDDQSEALARARLTLAARVDRAASADAVASVPTVAMGNPFDPEAPGASQAPLDFTEPAAPRRAAE